MAASSWAGSGSELCKYIAEQSNKTLKAYHEQPYLVAEHANHEEDTARGGYAGRQLFELVQNGAGRPLRTSRETEASKSVLRKAISTAPTMGEPIDTAGITALMFSHLSPKRGTAEIGRFGLGFKSVLGVTDTPEFFSRAGSFYFDREVSRKRIQEVVANADRYPVLRLAFPIDKRRARKDRGLRNMKRWASNVVRLPLKPGACASLGEQMADFPAEFLLFVEHVHRLTLRNLANRRERIMAVTRNGRECVLRHGSERPARWMLFSRTHRLSADARADRRALDDNEEVPIHWAAPLDRLDQPGRFWAFFPTMTSSLAAGILNAPWKTNEDRQNLLPGPYNEELIETAAALIADSLPTLANEDDPARHLDALPRRQEAGDSEQSIQLREHLLDKLREREIIPDQDGILRTASSLNYPPGRGRWRRAGALVGIPEPAAGLAAQQSRDPQPACGH